VEDEGGRTVVSKLMEELIEKEKKESAIRLLKIGKLSDEEIAFGLGVSVEVLRVLKKYILI